MWLEVFEIVSPTDDFETVKNEITLLAAEISKTSSKSQATPWGWTFDIWKLFMFFIHVIIQN